MHRGLPYWPETGVVCDTDVDYICPSYNGSRKGNFENNPKPAMDICAYGLYGCWEKQWRTLTTLSYTGLHQAEGLLHKISIALSLAGGLSQSDLLFPPVRKPRMDTNTLTSVMGIMRRARDVDQYPQAQPDGNRGREEEDEDQDVTARGVK